MTGLCGNTFDGKHHYAPRTWGSRQTGNMETVIACVCGSKCPDALLPEVQAALKATEIERERQRLLSVNPSHEKSGTVARGLMQRLL